MRIQCPENLRFPSEGSSAEGKSGPKARPRGVVDGQQVNIPVLFFIDNEGRRRIGELDVGYQFKRSRC